jgi:cysteine-S-conjugate beta-lyase
MTKSSSCDISTLIVHADRDPSKQGWMVNPPIYQTSTIVFPTLNDLLNAEKGYSNNNLVTPYELKYGRYGTQTNFTLEKAIAEIEGGYNSFVTSSGASAINTALIAFLKQGDHMLVVDNAYSPSSGFADKFMKKFGVKTTYFNPDIGENIKDLFQDNTKVILLESPGSLTFEIQDVKAICDIARKHNIITIVDNSWGSGVYFKPISQGADISIIAATKYINGHSDVVMGAITIADKKHFKVMYEAFRYMAPCAAPFSSYMAQRGLRTMKLRMDQSFKSALKIAQWLESHSKVEAVIYPALESHPDHKLWQRDFTGAAGIFSFVLKDQYQNEQIAKMVDNLKYYGMGYSWGGYESLILPFSTKGVRTAKKWQYEGRNCFRISVGLESTDDLIKDLDEGLGRLS